MGKLGELSELTTASMWYGTRGTTGTLRCCLRPKLNFNSISFSALLVFVVLLFVLDLAQCRKVCYNTEGRGRAEGGSTEMQLQLRSLEEVCHSYSSRHWSRFDFGSFLSMSPWMKLNAASQQAPSPAPHSTSTLDNLNFRPDPSLKRGGTDVRLLQLWLSPTATAAGLAAACFWSWLLVSCSSNSNNNRTGWACGCRRTKLWPSYVGVAHSHEKRQDWQRGRCQAEDSAKFMACRRQRQQQRQQPCDNVHCNENLWLAQIKLHNFLGKRWVFLALYS